MSLDKRRALNNLGIPTGATGITPPSITYQGATMVQAPAQKALAAYYCPDVVPTKNLAAPAW